MKKATLALPFFMVSGALWPFGLRGPTRLQQNALLHIAPIGEPSIPAQWPG
jgi:hypothetical protein